MCAKCGLKWSYPMPDKNEMDDHYSSYYCQRKNRRVEKTHLNNILSIISFRNSRSKIFLKRIEKYTKKGLLLDIGCGEGEILIQAKLRNWNVIGTEYSLETKEYLKTKGIEVIINEEVSLLKLEKNFVDCIVAKHLIEHLPNPYNFLIDIKKFFSKNGIIAIKTPSCTSIRARLGLCNWHFVNPPEHLWSFNKNNFRKLVEKANYEVIDIKDSYFIDELTCFAKPVIDEL